MESARVCSLIDRALDSSVSERNCCMVLRFIERYECVVRNVARQQAQSTHN